MLTTSNIRTMRSFTQQKNLRWILRQSWVLIYAMCLVAFLYQLGTLIYSYANPNQTITKIEKKNLNEMKFPVIFKICIKPGFDTEELLRTGYKQAARYFVGESRYNKTLVGWAGHTEEGGIIGDVEGKNLVGG